MKNKTIRKMCAMLAIASWGLIGCSGAEQGKNQAQEQTVETTEPTATPYPVTDYTISETDCDKLKKIIGGNYYCNLVMEKQGVISTDKEKMEFVEVMLTYFHFDGLEKNTEDKVSIKVEDADAYLKDAFGSGLTAKADYQGVKLRDGSFVYEKEEVYHHSTRVRVDCVKQVSEKEVEVKGLLNLELGDDFKFDWFTATFEINQESRFGGLTMKEVVYSEDKTQKMQKAYADFILKKKYEDGIMNCFAQDINGDKIAELFLENESNGKVSSIDCYTFDGNKVVEVDTKAVGDLAKMDYIGFKKNEGTLMLETGEYSSDAIYLVNYYVGLENNALVIKDQFSSYDYTNKEDSYYHGSETTENSISEEDYFSLYEKFQSEYEESDNKLEEYDLGYGLVSKLGETIYVEDGE